MQGLPNVPVEDIVEIVGLLDKYGYLMVFAAVFIVLSLLAVLILFAMVIKQFKIRDNQYQSLLNRTVEQNSQLLRNTLEGGNLSSDLIKSSVGHLKVVEEHLKYVCAITKCDRIGLYVFHNGQRLTTGAHIVKFSCISEYATLSKYYYADVHKDKPVSVIQPVCNNLLDSHWYKVLKITDVEDGAMQKWFTDYPVKSLLVKAVFDKNGEIIGFVTAAYKIHFLNELDLEAVEKEIKGLANKIGIVLDLGLLEKEAKPC